LDELGKIFSLAALLAALTAYLWFGVYLLRSRRMAGGSTGVLFGVVGLAIYAWLAHGFRISNEVDLELLASSHAIRQAEPGVERARAEYYQSGKLIVYRDKKDAVRTFEPSREDRTRRERRVARVEGHRRGARLSGYAMYAALAAAPLAIVFGLLWPRRPWPPPAPVEPGPRRWVPRVTLLEVIIVVVILGVLAAVAKRDEDWNLAAGSTVRDAAVKLELLKPDIAEFRGAHSAWPARNADIGLPNAGFAVSGGRYTLSLQGDGGVVLKTRWGEATFRPAVDAKGEIAWLCAYETAPKGFQPVGANRTTLPVSHLPGECRE
jgi:hypothetical protein